MNAHIQYHISRRKIKLLIKLLIRTPESGFLVRRIVVRRIVARRGVARCGVARCGVARCGVARCAKWHFPVNFCDLFTFKPAMNFMFTR